MRMSELAPKSPKVEIYRKEGEQAFMTVITIDDVKPDGDVIKIRLSDKKAKDSARKAIRSIAANALNDKRCVISTSGEHCGYRLQIKARNGLIVLDKILHGSAEHVEVLRDRLSSIEFPK